MAGNPRKFSEKIALHMQKQAEESAAFEQIMKSVSDVKPNTPNTTSQHLAPLLNQRHGGSLPNVNQMAQQGDKGHASRQLFNQSTSPGRGSRNSIGPVRRDRQPRAADHSPYNSPTSLLSSSIPSGQTGGFGSSGLPNFFCGNNYLPLPENAGCRRFNSDSALNSMLIPSTVPHSSEESSNNSNDPYDYLNQNPNSTGSNRTSPHQHDSPGGRALSGSGDGGPYLEIPQNSSPLTGSGASAGSLPDLTNPAYSFPSPMQPLDLEEHQQLNHSPYSTSPVYSPSNLSSSPLGASGVLHRSQQPSAQVQQPARSPTSGQMHNNPLFINATNNSFQQSFPQDSNMWRNPQRPSPQNSPNPYQSPSPQDGGQWSAPSSPSGQQGATSQSDYYLNQHQLQQHFENITVADRDRNSGSWHQGANQYYSNPNQTQLGDGATAGANQTSPHHHQQQPQTPQTPSSIPEIILSEFLGPDYSELRPSDFEGLFRDGLGPLDPEAFQLLNETDALQLDPNDEDSFRLDRL